MSLSERPVDPQTVVTFHRYDGTVEAVWETQSDIDSVVEDFLYGDEQDNILALMHDGARVVHFESKCGRTDTQGILDFIEAQGNA